MHDGACNCDVDKDEPDVSSAWELLLSLLLPSPPLPLLEAAAAAKKVSTTGGTMPLMSLSSAVVITPCTNALSLSAVVSMIGSQLGLAHRG
jgi:hypothetical protein